MWCGVVVVWCGAGACAVTFICTHACMCVWLGGWQEWNARLDADAKLAKEMQCVEEDKHGIHHTTPHLTTTPHHHTTSRHIKHHTTPHHTTPGHTTPADTKQ